MSYIEIQFVYSYYIKIGFLVIAIWLSHFKQKTLYIFSTGFVVIPLVVIIAIILVAKENMNAIFYDEIKFCIFRDENKNFNKDLISNLGLFLFPVYI